MQLYETPDCIYPALRDISLAQAGAGGCNTQLGQVAEAPLEGRLGERSPGHGREAREDSWGT